MLLQHLQTDQGIKSAIDAEAITEDSASLSTKMLLLVKVMCDSVP